MKNIPLGSRVSVVLALSLIVYSGAAVSRLNGQTIDTGFVYGGAAFENRLDGAGRFGAGLDFRLAPQFDLGGELGAIFKNDVGILASANLTYHFTRPNRRKEREGWDPFLVGGVSGARISGTGGFYANLGGGTNYWLNNRWALRGEFKAYPGGQDLGGFAEFRFGVTFRP